MGKTLLHLRKKIPLFQVRSFPQSPVEIPPFCKLLKSTVVQGPSASLPGYQLSPETTRIQFQSDRGRLNTFLHKVSTQTTGGARLLTSSVAGRKPTSSFRVAPPIARSRKRERPILGDFENGGDAERGGRFEKGESDAKGATTEKGGTGCDVTRKTSQDTSRRNVTGHVTKDTSRRCVTETRHAERLARPPGNASEHGASGHGTSRQVRAGTARIPRTADRRTNAGWKKAPGRNL